MKERPLIMPLQGTFPPATHEEERLKDVLLYGFDEGRAETELDDICQLARSLFHVSVALVTLVGRDEQTVLAKCGVDTFGTARADAFCTYAILHDEVLVVPDAMADPRFANNPNVTGMYIRFYAGAPLIVRSDIRLGTLCLMDPGPREFSPEEAAQLQTLAQLVVNELRRRRMIIDFKREQDLQRQTARLAKVGSWVLDLNARSLKWSEETYRIFEVDFSVTPTPEMVEGFWGSGGAGGAKRAAQGMEEILRSGTSFDIELPIVTALGNRKWIRCVAEAELSEGGVIRITGSIQDVTAEHGHAVEIERLAYTDMLTGLPNRAMFLKTLSAAMELTSRKPSPLGLVLFDLDHFKDVNDILGHEAGDRVVTEVGSLLSRAYGTEALTARIGGDEFAVIVPHRDLERLTSDTQALLRRYGRSTKGERLPVTLSAGCAFHPDQATTAEDLLRRADIALFRAKSQGRNRLVAFEQSMQDDIERQLALLHDVRRGINEGEFLLFYQPIVQIQGTPKVQGFEAMMRWRHPQKGVLAPGAFAPAFDDPELSLALGEVALDTALAQMRPWLDAGVGFGRIAVNLSAAQFRGQDLAGDVAEKLKRFDVPAHRLTLEVTENVYLGWNGQLVAETIRALHDQGILIALDDFGTGYASLTSLKQFPIDRLKIDQSFIRDLSDPAVVAAVLTLGRSMGIKVIAEGVETAEQLRILEQMGCDKAQGYYFARPMPAEEVPAFLGRFAGSTVSRRVAAA